MSDIRDRLDLVGGLADPGALPEAHLVRRGGDRRRLRARGVAGALALVLAGAVAVPVVDVVRDRQAAPAPPAHGDRGGVVPRNSGLPGWRLARHIPVPDEGVVFRADGSLWVTDRDDGRVDASGRPTGVLHRIDPETGRTTATVPGAVGGWPAVYRGAIWLSSPVAQRLIRVDLDTLEVRMIRTSVLDAPGLRGLAVAGGSLWVSNPDAGRMARVDPVSGQYTPVELGSATNAIADPSSPVVWQGLVWTLLLDTEEIVAVDPGSGDVVLRADNPTGRTIDNLFVDERGRLVVTGGGQTFPLELTASNELRSGTAEAPVLPGLDVSGAVMAYDRLWQIGWDDGELIEVDPDSREVLGRVDLPTTGPQVDVTPGLLPAFGSLWVRVFNRVYEYRPVDD